MNPRGTVVSGVGGLHVTQGGCPAAHASLWGSAGPPGPHPAAATGPWWQERAARFLAPRWGPGHGGAGLGLGQCALGRGRGATPALGSRGPCVFSGYHWSLIRVPSQEYHPLNVTPLSQIGVVGMGKWELTPLYPLNSP